MATVLTFIDDTLKLMGVLEAGESGSNEDVQDMVKRLNDFIEELQTQSLTIPAVVRTEYPLVSGTASYTLGVGGDFNQERPVWIDRSSIIQLQNPVKPIELPMETLTVERFQQIPVKLTDSAFPTKVYIDGAFPLRNVTFWPIPNTAIIRWALYWLQPLQEFISATPLTETVSFPPGAEKMLRYNLAVECAPEWGRSLNQMILAVARNTMANYKKTNKLQQQRRMRTDPALMSTASKRWDYRTGDEL